LPEFHNSIEVWYKAFSKRASIVQSTNDKFADKIRCEQSKFEIGMIVIRQGQEPKLRKAVYRKLDENIQLLVADY
jgi:hypothetical protein